MTTTALHSEQSAANGVALRTLAKKNGLTFPGRLVPDGTDEKGWATWQKYLATRKRPAPPLKLKNATPLLWGVTGEVCDRQSTSLIRQLAHQVADQDSAELLRPWLAEASQRTADPALGLEAIAWSHALPSLAQHIEPASWWELIETLQGLSEDAAAISLADAPWAQQLLAGELPLTLAWVLPELKVCKQSAKRARAALSDGPLELLDGEGMPHADLLPVARGLLACWTRAAMLGQQLEKSSFNRDARIQVEWFVTQTLRLCRYDGTQMLSAPAADASDVRFLEAAAATLGDRADQRVARINLAGGKPALRSSDSSILLPAPVHSEWAELTVLRTDWQRDAARLAVAHNAPEMSSELSVGPRTLWSGTCEPQIDINGRRIERSESWREVCWFSDHDVDYLELEAELPHGYQLQRQFLLSRSEELLFVADSILGEEVCQIDYQCTWPVQQSVSYRAEDETRECTLVDGKPAAQVFPLALPEWRSERHLGELLPREEGLLLTQAATARNLYAPLLFDLRANRFRKANTWRQLTVGEGLQIQPRDVAAGYRVQIGSRQWLIYRSLRVGGNRTVLGQNLNSDFLLGRFTRSGEVESLLEIEAE